MPWLAREFQNVTADQRLIEATNNVNGRLAGFSAKNFHQDSTNSGFVLRPTDANGPGIHVNLAANETTREFDLDVNISKGLELTDATGQFDVTVFWSF